MANSFYTKDDRVVHELFRSIERYDMKKLLKAASDSNLSVISEEEMHQLIQQRSKIPICEGLKKLIMKDNGRLKRFAQFILDYNSHVQNKVLATIQLLDGNQQGSRRSTTVDSQCSTYGEAGSLLPGPFRASIQQHHRSRSSSGSNTPTSPMDVDSKEAYLAQEASDHDVGYATATCTCTCTEPSSKDTLSQGQYDHLSTRAGNSPPFQMVRKVGAKAHITDLDTDECLSQPTFEEHQITDAWLPRQDHHYAYYSDCLAQDTSQEQLGWPPQIKEHYEDILHTLNINALLPQLLMNNLLTVREYQEINRDRDVPLQQNEYFLLTVLPRKGRDAFNVFLKCLKAEKRHLGHLDLVEILCNEKR